MPQQRLPFAQMSLPRDLPISDDFSKPSSSNCRAQTRPEPNGSRRDLAQLPRTRVLSQERHGSSLT